MFLYHPPKVGTVVPSFVVQPPQTSRLELEDDWWVTVRRGRGEVLVIVVVVGMFSPARAMPRDRRFTVFIYSLYPYGSGHCIDHEWRANRQEHQQHMPVYNMIRLLDDMNEDIAFCSLKH